MPERAVKIGGAAPLTCIVTDPETAASGLGVVVLNSGVMHHIGTCRLSVRICRAFASSGQVAARFDFSGVGDSPSRGTQGSFGEIAAGETSEVMDFLQAQRGVDRFILVGLCSGADAAYATALVDERVVGICQLDPYAYRNFRYYLNHYLPRVFRATPWLNGLKQLLPDRTGGEVADEEFLEMPSYIREFPPRAEVARGLALLAERGVEIYTLFTGGHDDYVNYADQYRDSFPEIDFKDLLRVDLLPECSHIVMEPEYQGRVTEGLCNWYRDRFVPASAAA